MLIYHILNAVILGLGLVFCYKNPTQKKKLIFICASFTLLFLVSMFRVNIGHDYIMYFEGFLKMGIDGFSTLNYLDWEWGFNIFTKIIVFITRSEKVYFAICALICLVPVAWFIYKNSSNVWLSVLLYVNLSFFYCTMNFLRQSIAISIMLIAWHFLKKRKLIPFVAILALAAFFHTTVLIMLPMYFLVKAKPKLKTVLVYCLGLLCFYISSDGIINLLTEVFHTEYQQSAFITEGLPFIYSIIPIIFTAISVLLGERLVKRNPLNQYYINMLFYGTFFMVVMSKHSILERLSYYPYIFIILLVPEFVAVVKDIFQEKYYKSFLLDLKRRRYIKEQDINAATKHGFITMAQQKAEKIGLLVTLGILVVAFAYNIFGMYVGQSGIHGVFPYQTWLFK